MGKRRFAQVSTSDEEEEAPPPPPASKKERKLPEEEKTNPKNKNEPEQGQEQEEEGDDPKPIGEVLRVSGKGRGIKKHYAAYELDDNRYELEDSVLLTPEDRTQKPYVAIIKVFYQRDGDMDMDFMEAIDRIIKKLVLNLDDALKVTVQCRRISLAKGDSEITWRGKTLRKCLKDIYQVKDGSMVVLGQWFYRPEEAEKKGGGSWQARDTRELFYSFHHDEVSAESVMHKCVVHFVPLNKQLPRRSQHPGFIVQKVYDTVERKLWKLTDKDYEDSKQHEIDLLVQKTRERLGELPDLEVDYASADQDEHLKSRRNLRRRNMSPIDVARDDEASTKPDQPTKPKTPGSGANEVSEFYTILASFKALTGDKHRNNCLEKLLQGVQFVCNSKETVQVDGTESGGSVHASHNATCIKSSEALDGSQEKGHMDARSICWPDDAVPAVVALEKASFEALGSDSLKYNQKMRQLIFNLKSNALLTTRLLNKDLEPSVILNMSPSELKDGLTSEEKSTQEPQESEPMQMTDARCSRCMERKVAVADIIHGGYGDRYQLECIQCGNTWYAPRDAISSLTIETPSAAGNVGTAPWATAKFEDVEKKLVSPRESEKPAADIFKRKTAAYMPVLDSQKSFNRLKTEDPLPAAVTPNNNDHKSSNNVKTEDHPAVTGND